MQASLVTDCLNNAVNDRNITQENDLLFHSDQGSQYTSELFQSTLAKYNITASMSRKGNC